MEKIFALIPILVLCSLAQASQVDSQSSALAERTKAINTVSKLYLVADQSDDLECDIEHSSDGTQTSFNIKEFSGIMMDEIMITASESERFSDLSLNYPFKVSQDLQNPNVFILTEEFQSNNYPDKKLEEYATKMTYTFTLTKSLNEPETRVVQFVRSIDFETKYFAKDNKTFTNVEKDLTRTITCKSVPSRN